MNRPSQDWKLQAERLLIENDLLVCTAQLKRFEVAEQRRRIAALHPILFGRIYFPEWMGKDTPEFHWEIADGYIRYNRFAVAAPVGSAKTTILTKICTLWSIFFEQMDDRPVNDVLIISSAAEIAGMFLDDMSAKMRASDELREDFGEFMGSHWGSQTLEFILDNPDGSKRTAFIRALGRGGALRGRRPDRIVVDDPEDEESVKSEKQRGDFSVWFWGAVVNRLDEAYKKLTYVGTCMTPETFLVGLINAPPDGWYVKSYAMLDEATEHSLWESKYPIAFLKQRKSEIGEERFRAEFQNDPVSNWHQLIFDTDKVVIKAHAIDQDDWVSVCVDPSYRPGGDPWAISMIAVDLKGNWHWTLAQQDATGMDGWMWALLEVRQNHPRIHALGVETGGGQVGTEYILNDWMRRHGVGFPSVHYLKHSHVQGRKTNRISQLTNIVNSGRLHLPPGSTLAFNALKSYRAGLDKQDDHLLDSLAMHLEVQRARTPSEKPLPTPEEIRHLRFTAMRKAVERSKIRTHGRSRYL